MKAKLCYYCSKQVDKDVVALNKKLLGHYTKRVLCLTCLAEYIGCTEEVLLNRIKELKEIGCTLFT